MSSKFSKAKKFARLGFTFSLESRLGFAFSLESRLGLTFSVFSLNV